MLPPWRALTRVLRPEDGTIASNGYAEGKRMWSRLGSPSEADRRVFIQVAWMGSWVVSIFTAFETAGWVRRQLDTPFAELIGNTGGLAVYVLMPWMLFTILHRFVYGSSFSLVGFWRQFSGWEHEDAASLSRRIWNGAVTGLIPGILLLNPALKVLMAQNPEWRNLAPWGPAIVGMLVGGLLFGRFSGRAHDNARIPLVDQASFQLVSFGREWPWPQDGYWRITQPGAERSSWFFPEAESYWRAVDEIRLGPRVWTSWVSGAGLKEVAPAPSDSLSPDRRAGLGM